MGGSIEGFFLDDASHGGSMTAPIMKVTTYINGKGKGTIANPGIASNDTVLFEAATAVVQCENTAPRPVAFASQDEADKSVMILHGVAASAWREDFSAARDAGFKY